MASAIADAFRDAILGKIASNTADRYRIALYGNTNAPTKAIAAYTNTGEIATVGTTYVNTGVAATTGWSLGTATLTATTLTFADLVKTTNNGETLTAYYGLIYDTADSNKVVAFLDFGGAKTANNGGTFTLDFPAALLTVSVS